MGRSQPLPFQVALFMNIQQLAKIEEIKSCHGSLKVKMLARNSEGLWLDSQWRIFFLDFSR